MKKTLVALAVLGSFAGVASAATSVTLYGTVDAGYEGWSYGKDFSSLNNTFVQGGTSEANSKIGVKGQEDLGNGLAATFQLEGDVNADVGSADLFNRESTVGLKGAFGHVRFGRALAAMDNGIGGFTVGERVASFDNYSSAARHSNSMFYDYSNSGFSVGGNVSTKGGALDVAEGADASKVGYGLYAKYDANNLGLGAAYQRDGNGGKEWGVGASYTFAPVTLGASYADHKNAASTKTRIVNAYVSGDVTANDTVYFQYNRNQEKTASNVKTTQNAYGLGYMHALSKRTSVYAETARTKRAGENGWDYSVAMRHKF